MPCPVIIYALPTANCLRPANSRLFDKKSGDGYEFERKREKETRWRRRRREYKVQAWPSPRPLLLLATITRKGSRTGEQNELRNGYFYVHSRKIGYGRVARPLDLSLGDQTECTLTPFFSLFILRRHDKICGLAAPHRCRDGGQSLIFDYYAVYVRALWLIRMSRVDLV